MPGTTPRLLLPFPLSSESPNGPSQIQALATALDSAVVYGEGTLSARPTSTSGSPGIQGRFYYVTGDATAANNGILWWDTGTSWVPITTGQQPYLHYQDQQASGTASPSTVPTAWTTVPLNTETSDTQAIGTLASNQVTLPAGTYLAQAGFAYNDAGTNGGVKGRLRNMTDSATLLVGPSLYVGEGGGADPGVWAPVLGEFTLSGSKAIALQYYVTGSGVLGKAINSGEIEVYSDLQLCKFA